MGIGISAFAVVYWTIELLNLLMLVVIPVFSLNMLFTLRICAFCCLLIALKSRDLLLLCAFRFWKHYLWISIFLTRESFFCIWKIIMCTMTYCRLLQILAPWLNHATPYQKKLNHATYCWPQASCYTLMRSMFFYCEGSKSRAKEEWMEILCSLPCKFNIHLLSPYALYIKIKFGDSLVNRCERTCRIG